MKLIIAGGRDFEDFNLLDTVFNAYYSANYLEDIEIISGTANGADKLGEQLADKYNLKVHRFPADWDKYGKAAGYRRNSEMADEGTHLLAFWDKRSKGTKHMINLATKKDLHVFVVNYEFIDKTQPAIYTDW
jgi:hypothetical protein